MALTRIRFMVTAICMTVLASSSASAQVLGIFTWQMQPYCNRITLTVTTVSGNFTLDGFDDQCGATDKASAVGIGTFNATGNVTVNFTIVTATSGKPVHVSAVVNPANGNGTWNDSVGNSGSFVLGGTVPGLPVRPLPTSGVAPATITGNEIAPGAVGALQIAADAVGASEIAAGAVGASEIAVGAVRSGALGTITQRSATSASIANNSSGSATASCLAGEQFLSGGNDGFTLDGYHVVASRQQGNGWQVFLFNATGGARTVTAHVYCLAP